MTETMLDVSAPPATDGSPSRRHAAEPPAGRRAPDRRLLAGLAAVVAVALLGGGYLLLHHGGSSPSAAAAAPVVPHVRTAPAATGAPAAKPSPAPAAVPPSYDGTVGRDPFKPLVVPPAPSTAPKPSVSAGAVPGLPGVPGAPLPGGGVVAGQPVPVQPDWIELATQTGTKSATFQVHYTDGRVTTYANIPAPPPGGTTTFGTFFALISLQDGLAVVQIGDGTPFNLPVGDTGRQSL